MKPDVYIMTGSKRPNSNVLPFGYAASHSEISAPFYRLLTRTGLSEIAPVKQQRVWGVCHHFYNHPYNIIGMEILAKARYPQTFCHLDPTTDYHYLMSHFTRQPTHRLFSAPPDSPSSL